MLGGQAGLLPGSPQPARQVHAHPLAPRLHPGRSIACMQLHSRGGKGAEATGPERRPTWRGAAGLASAASSCRSNHQTRVCSRGEAVHRGGWQGGAVAAGGTACAAMQWMPTQCQRASQPWACGATLMRLPRCSSPQRWRTGTSAAHVHSFLMPPVRLRIHVPPHVHRRCCSAAARALPARVPRGWRPGRPAPRRADQRRGAAWAARAIPGLATLQKRRETGRAYRGGGARRRPRRCAGGGAGGLPGARQTRAQSARCH